MARTIYGQITDQTGAGASGLRVQAWDDDFPDGNDFMGETQTDAQGNYIIHYEGGHWDPAPDAITIWRPDIFIAVQAQTASGQWAQLAKSKVHANHKLRDDLKINLSVQTLPVERARTTFQPQAHGFKFDNVFEVSPEIFGLDLGTWEMGFCGGMCAAALHRYYAQEVIPPTTITPAPGSPLYLELKDRQQRSMPVDVMRQVYDWQSSPDEGSSVRKASVGARTKRQWPVLKAALDAGRPTQLVLIRVEGYFANPSKNHQVVAIGYDWSPTCKDLLVYVYDPNRRDVTHTLTLNLGLPSSRLEARDSTGQRLRGFFVNPAGAAAAQ